ncbi:MAG TPA: hypothetical protein VFV08_16520, partial [Puia sp.]|nr:hypothetical protein [Puia sp.]
MIYSALVSNEDELLQIHRLNHENLREHISYTERMAEGFVSWLYPLDLLKKMHELAPSAIIKNDQRV